jgi:prephenate dehydratase
LKTEESPKEHGEASNAGGKRVAYQGEPGAYSDEAVAALFPGAEAVGFATFRLTFEALGVGAVEAAVLPVENSTAGVVQEVSDLLWDLPEHRA